MLENCDYDHYLDLCLDILSEKKYGHILQDFIKMDKKTWIKINTMQELFLFPDNIYFFYETLPGCTNLLFVFINIDTLEISTAIYYSPHTS